MGTSTGAIKAFRKGVFPTRPELKILVTALETTYDYLLDGKEAQARSDADLIQWFTQKLDERDEKIKQLEKDLSGEGGPNASLKKAR